MPQLTRPTEEAVTGDVRRVVRVGVTRARQESLANLDALLDAVRRAERVPDLDLADLLRKGLERIEDAGIRAALAVLLDLRETRRSLGMREDEVAETTHFARTTVRQEKRAEWSRELAERLLELFDEASEIVRERFPVDDWLAEGFATACTLAGVQLAAMRRPDGSWPAVRGDRGTVAVTARAGAALHKAFGGEWARAALEATVDWVGDHRERDGQYGDRVAQRHFAGLPLREEIVPTPLDTAAAVKFVHQFEGPRTRAVALGVVRLIENQIRERGWSATGRGDDSDVLATAYVVDALALVTPGIRHMLQTLDRNELETLDGGIDRSLRWGLEWLRDHRSNGGWALEGRDEPHPTITAHVLGFAWQAIVPALEPTPECLRTMTVDGGIPAETGQAPTAALTAMTLLGLLRAASEGYEELMAGWARYLVRVTGQRPAPALDVYAATFLLLLGQPLFDWLSGTGWQERTRAAIEAIFEAREAGKAAEAIADAAVARLAPGHRHVRDALMELL
jgi:hypothetical protein